MGSMQLANHPSRDYVQEEANLERDPCLTMALKVHDEVFGAVEMHKQAIFFFFFFFFFF